MNRPGRRARRASIGVESMEGRVVLSTVHAMVLPTQGALVRGTSYLDLQGSAQGAANRVVGSPDVGTAVMVHGSGQFPGQGKMEVSGYFHGTGFIATGSLNGTLKLSNAKGSVTLQLQGPATPGFTAPTSGTYQFSIQKGTGALAHDFGSGSVDVVLGPRSFSLNFHGKPNTY
jgi:hypothetical protein